MSNILSGIMSGLNSTYKYFQSEMTDNKVTYDGITELMGDEEKAHMVNQGFAAYLQKNFNSVDKNADGIISADEMDKITAVMSKAGLTKDELTELYSSGASGLSNSTMDMILKYFDEMDTNKDGRLTSAEISAFSVNSAKQEKIDEFAHKQASNMSVFYGSESSSDPGAYSMLSYKYKSSKQQ